MLLADKISKALYFGLEIGILDESMGVFNDNRRDFAYHLTPEFSGAITTNGDVGPLVPKIIPNLILGFKDMN